MRFTSSALLVMLAIIGEVRIFSVI